MYTLKIVKTGESLGSTKSLSEVSEAIGRKTKKHDLELLIRLPVDFECRVGSQPGSTRLFFEVFHSQNFSTTKERVLSLAEEAGLKIECEKVRFMLPGDRIPVKSIGIEFRRFEDFFVDRGLVVVSPGKPTMAKIIFLATTTGSATDPIKEMISDAEDEVKEKILSLVEK